MSLIIIIISKALASPIQEKGRARNSALDTFQAWFAMDRTVTYRPAGRSVKWGTYRLYRLAVSLPRHSNEVRYRISRWRASEHWTADGL